MLTGMRPNATPSSIAKWWRYITKAAVNTAGRLTMENVTMSDTKQSAAELSDYERRVEELEAEGLTRSDAQGVADVEVMRWLL